MITLQHGVKSLTIRLHNVVERGVLQAMWEEIADKVGHRDQLIIC